MTLLTRQQKDEIKKKINSGLYSAWLSNYSIKKGQSIIIYRIKSNEITKIIPVRLPDIPRPCKKPRMNEKFDKRSGWGFKIGKFTTINAPLEKVLL